MTGGLVGLLIGSMLLLASIIAGLLSARIGAPLLLTFLGLGMLAGEDGPGGIVYTNLELSFLIGNSALAIILFDGGLRTPWQTLRAAWAPALALATLGTLITAGIVAAGAHWLFHLKLLPAFLMGAIVAATDAPAVFMMLGRQGVSLRDRLRATLEVESGSNDPMGIFLTMACVTLIRADGAGAGWSVLADFVLQMGLGVAMGWLGGTTLAELTNRLELAAGLYPILALAICLLAFSSTALVGGSGYLAMYVAGIVYGNRRVRARTLTCRFFDGLMWLAQIVMFLLLGLLVSPHLLADQGWLALGIAGVLIFVARPVAVAVALAPFGFSGREQLFASWVGLRGAVPIFLALVPALTGIDESRIYFNVAFVVVLVSLALQGWTAPWMARRLGVALAPSPEAADKLEFDMLHQTDRDLVAYTVKPHSRAADQPFERLEIPERARLVSVIRDGTVISTGEVERLASGDVVLVLTPPELALAVDRVFSRRFKSAAAFASRDQGDFIVDGATPLEGLARAYDIPIRHRVAGMTVGDFVKARIGGSTGRGDRLRLGPVELIVVDMVGPDVKEVGLLIRTEDQPTNRWPRRLRPVIGRLQRLFVREDGPDNG
ncbi:MAG: potassium/proton antiporter [Rhodospirillaceae bacterium]